MKYEEALNLLRTGKKVARSIWDDGVYLILKGVRDLNKSGPFFNDNDNFDPNYFRYNFIFGHITFDVLKREKYLSSESFYYMNYRPEVEDVKAEDWVEILDE